MDKAPVFVKVDEYKDIVDIVALMHEKVRQCKFLLDKIAELKGQEDNTLAAWAKELESVETSISTIDKTLVQPEV